MSEIFSIDPFAKHYNLGGNDIEESATGVAKMFFHNMLKPVLEELTNSPLNQGEYAQVTNYLWHEVLTDSLLADDKTGLKKSIETYIKRQYDRG